jgi:hypothetical protein
MANEDVLHISSTSLEFGQLDSNYQVMNYSFAAGAKSGTIQSLMPGNGSKGSIKRIGRVKYPSNSRVFG